MITATIPYEGGLYKEACARIACARKLAQGPLVAWHLSKNSKLYSIDHLIIFQRAIFGLNSEMKSRKEINKQNYRQKRDSIKAKYSPAQHKAKYSPAQRKLQHSATYSPAQRKRYYSPARRKLQHKTTYSPAQRKLEYIQQNQQVPKRSAMSSSVIIAAPHLQLNKQASSFQLRSENRWHMPANAIRNPCRWRESGVFQCASSAIKS
jgi:hypothetical protein